MFNLAGDRLVSLADVLDAAQVAAGHRVAIAEKQASESSVRNPVSEKAERILGCRPTTPFPEGLRRIVAFLEQGHRHG